MGFLSKIGREVGRFNPLSSSNSGLNRGIGLATLGGLAYANSGAASKGNFADNFDMRSTGSNSTFGIGGTQADLNSYYNDLPSGMTQSAKGDAFTNYNNQFATDSAAPSWYDKFTGMSQGAGLATQAGLGLVGNQISANAQERIANRGYAQDALLRQDALAAKAETEAAQDEASGSFADAFSLAKKRRDTLALPVAGV